MIHIAIDGPCGGGKTTVAKLLSKKLNIICVDTGAMYRALAYYINTYNIDIYKINNIDSFLQTIDLNIDYINNKQIIYLNNINITDKLNYPNISMLASEISKIYEVRCFLVKKQQQIAKINSCVIEGRDICSVVLPNAEYKFFLTADINTRAQRRYNELINKNINVQFNDIIKQIQSRDYNDTHRVNSPLIKTQDSILIDSTNLSINDVVNKILSYIK